MIEVEGYKAFRGKMLITPSVEGFKPLEIVADWIYKPEFKCWYGGGSSFPEEICQVIEEI